MGLLLKVAVFSLCLCLASALPHGQGQVYGVVKNVPTPSESFDEYAQLDLKGEYFLFWKHNVTHITFETHVKTLGYVGFGLSHNGNMYPADVVIGWVENGVVHFKDRHTIGYYEPIIDESQDWTLLAGSESGEHTVLKFARKLDTCDKDDIAINGDTIRVIYSFHPEDPVHETGLPYHGAEHRGAKSLMLLDPVPPQSPMPSDTKQFDMLNHQTTILPQRTYYRCTIFKLPELAQKHHMIQWEPVLEPGNEEFLHHMLVYTCPGHVDDSLVGSSYECYENNPPRQTRGCKNVFVAWAVGGDAFNIPEHVGLSLGTPNDPKFVVLETHYNNPSRKHNVVDSSGMRMHYTASLRQYDGGILELGSAVDDLMIIPPGFDNFVSKGFCLNKCVQEFTEHNAGGVNVIAVFLHTHLLGQAIRTRHFRNGTELEVLMKDDHYDFDFQEYRLMRHERVITKDDMLQTECYYKSRGKTGFTYGGLGTDDEMCLSFVMYYPKSPIYDCLTLPVYNKYGHHSRGALRSYLGSMDWSNATVRDDFQKVTDESLYYHRCGKDHVHRHHTEEVPPKIPKISKQPTKQCQQH